jgi:hypothetical protein
MTVSEKKKPDRNLIGQFEAKCPAGNPRNCKIPATELCCADCLEIAKIRKKASAKQREGSSREKK